MFYAVSPEYGRFVVAIHQTAELVATTAQAFLEDCEDAHRQAIADSLVVVDEAGFAAQFPVQFAAYNAN